MKTKNPAGLAGLRVCIICNAAHPRTAFVGRAGRTCLDCRTARKRTEGRPPTFMGEIYTAPELCTHVRPGALDAYALPSRHMGKRYYRDGRIEKVTDD